MAVRIHTAVKNADDYHGGFRFAIEDHMPLDRVRPQSSGDGIAQRAHAGGVAERLEGVPQMAEVGLLLHRAPSAMRVVANLRKIGQRRAGYPKLPSPDIS